MTRWAVYRHCERPIEVRGVLALFAVEGWWPERTASSLERVLLTGDAVAAWSGDHVIGFARVLSDGVFRAYVEDVIVDRGFRCEGVATSLVDALIAELPSDAVVSVFCAPSLEPVYGAMGFTATKQTVMHRALRP